MKSLNRRDAITVIGAGGFALLANSATIAQPADNQLPSKEVARLVELLNDANPTVRKQAAVALGEINRAIKKALQKSLADADAEVRGAVAAALDAPKEGGLAAKACIKCSGKGETRNACNLCNGKKTIRCGEGTCSSGQNFVTKKPCVACRGTALVDCFGCKGSGEQTIQCSRCGGKGVER